MISNVGTDKGLLFTDYQINPNDALALGLFNICQFFPHNNIDKLVSLSVPYTWQFHNCGNMETRYKEIWNNNIPDITR